MKRVLLVASPLFFLAVAACSSSDDSGSDTTGGSGTAGSGTAGSATAGSGTAGKGTSGSGTSGSGTAGSGTAGSGTAGSGTAGSGTSGSGTAGTGTAGTGTAGTGTAGTGTAGSNPGDPFDQYRTLCVNTVNMYRATKGLPPLDRWTSAESCVDSECSVDGMANSPHKAFSSGMSCGANGQNECPGYGTNYASSLPQCLGQMWAEKDKAECAGCETCDFPYNNCTNCPFQPCGHYLNMKSKKFTKVACGFWDGGWYAQNYAP